MNRKGIIIVVSGFSGAGKGTVMKALTAKYDQYALSVSATTRTPRSGEVNGREYFFVTTEEFENKVIDLMGGYRKTKSRIAENYIPKNSDVEYTVVADNLEKLYGDFYAVRNNSFKIKKGEIFGLLGPNGAGKSTSFKMMCGLLKPTGGTARIMGIDIKEDPEKARAEGFLRDDAGKIQ